MSNISKFTKSRNQGNTKYKVQTKCKAFCNKN